MIERKQSCGSALAVPVDDVDDDGDSLPADLQANLPAHLADMRAGLADLGDKSDACAAWVANDDNLKKYLRRCGDADSAIESLRGDLTRRFRIPSCWD